VGTVVIAMLVEPGGAGDPPTAIGSVIGAPVTPVTTTTMISSPVTDEGRGTRAQSWGKGCQIEARSVVRLRYSIVIGLAVLVAGCSSQSAITPPASHTTEHGPTTSRAPSGPTVAQIYSAAANRVNGAYAQWTAELAGKAQSSDLAGPSATYAAALTTFDKAVKGLGIIRMPPATDIQTLLEADGATIRDLNSVGTQSPASLPQWLSLLGADHTRAAQAGDVVRADLGLPAG
jgi:hypothetical protein